TNRYANADSKIDTMYQGLTAIQPTVKNLGESLGALHNAANNSSVAAQKVAAVLQANRDKLSSQDQQALQDAVGLSNNATETIGRAASAATEAVSKLQI